MYWPVCTRGICEDLRFSLSDCYSAITWLTKTTNTSTATVYPRERPSAGTHDPRDPTHRRPHARTHSVQCAGILGFCFFLCVFYLSPTIHLSFTIHQHIPESRTSVLLNTHSKPVDELAYRLCGGLHDMWVWNSLLFPHACTINLKLRAVPLWDIRAEGLRAT